ncbi:hypothetical protein [Janthinobacterium agaricidamnosum]|uniref:Uncharacterized protein n=1 Tax=Janthinobacterium agaricidamnosum NBRC 102515 = DSM 9628 TaxID=1349767 RepID=W0V1B0_9BURK|nr:hypothetical protein [Janthinobacterium agaricidamnosum]CDG81661.1 putative uncharacterized protein [Janthinobacterium agaricidamnosum NBRC 102515 = DSM 9628]
MTIREHSSARAQLLKVFKQSIQATPGARAQLAQHGVAPQADGGEARPDRQPLGDEALDIPEAIVAWLAQLTLLYGVPFEYLVPDADMLPPESIRFFYLDQNWTDCLVDGAVNIALGSTQDYVHILTTFEEVARQAALGQNNVRAQLRKQALPANVQVDGTLTGVLLRSAVVSGWPGLEVAAFADAAGTLPLPLLRIDRLSDNVLICLFNGVPQLVDFSEPPEGLHFGVIGGSSGPTPYQVALRGVGGKYVAGAQINDGQGKAYTAPVTLRGGAASAGVLNVAQTGRDLIANLDQLGALQQQDGKPLFTASQFAVQMVRGAGLQQFKPIPPEAGRQLSSSDTAVNA